MRVAVVGAGGPVTPRVERLAELWRSEAARLAAPVDATIAALVRPRERAVLALSS